MQRLRVPPCAEPVPRTRRFACCGCSSPRGSRHGSWAAGFATPSCAPPGHDIDICCSGSWEQSAAALRAEGIAVVESGVKFGGITAVLDGERIEVTAYRLDGFYTDGRHPEVCAVRSASRRTSRAATSR